MTRIHSMLMRKVRGVRIVDLAGAACLVFIVLVVYASKAGAGAEGAKIADTDRQIAAEEQQVRVLRAQQAALTRPERLRSLAAQYLNMAPTAPSREVTPEGLLQIRQMTPAPHPATSPLAKPAPAAEVVR
jgi:cell division protein FtsL